MKDALMIIISLAKIRCFINELISQFLKNDYCRYEAIHPYRADYYILISF